MSNEKAQEGTEVKKAGKNVLKVTLSYISNKY